MIGFANAKINIGLQVIRKRTDGLHDLESVFYPVPLKDAIEIIANPSLQAGRVNFIQTGLKIPGSDAHNLCIRAYQLVHQQFPLPGIDLYLHKTIPFGAGLGGGSSDAVEVLKILNQLFDLKLTDSKFMELAQSLGSDCPFFLKNKPCFASGTGELLEEIDLSLRNYNLLLIKPKLSISTKDAFSGIQPDENAKNLREQITKEVSEWRNLIFNDFEAAYIRRFPIIHDLKNELYRQGAVYSAMSGSGSCVYALFNFSIHQDMIASLKHNFEEIEIFNLSL